MPSLESVAIGLTDEARTRLVALLDQQLADAFVLYAQARAFHWNIRSRTFAQDHALFEAEYDASAETVDAVAERARSLGGHPAGRLSDYLANARLSEVDSRTLKAEAMISAHLASHEAIIRTLREDAEEAGTLGDAGTQDFLIGLMADHEKRAWMLRARQG